MPDYIIFVDRGEGNYVKLESSGKSQESVADDYYETPEANPSDEIEVFAKSAGKRFGLVREVRAIGETPKRKRRKPSEQPVADAPEPGTEEAAEALSEEPAEDPNVEVGAGAPNEPEQEHVDPNGNSEEAEAKSPFKTRKS